MRVGHLFNIPDFKRLRSAFHFIFQNEGKLKIIFNEQTVCHFTAPPATAFVGTQNLRDWQGFLTRGPRTPKGTLKI